MKNNLGTDFSKNDRNSRQVFGGKITVLVVFFCGIVVNDIFKLKIKTINLIIYIWNSRCIFAFRCKVLLIRRVFHYKRVPLNTHFNQFTCVSD